ncbi:MAG: hypothetical protein E6Q67_12930 [Roseateles sp.]|nr:MAG: hypothetical protein E6Q67_12930 [Roseateles sp.]
MSITLSAAGTLVELPADLYWADETAWHPVEQSVKRTLTGALVISTASRVGGRPITLRPPVQLASWMPRAVVNQLKTWADTPGLVMTLTLHGTTRSVIWRHHDGEVMTSTPVLFFDDVQLDDAYTATLKFMEI